MLHSSQDQSNETAPPLPLLFPSLSLSPQKHGPRTHFHSSFFFYYSQPSMYRPSTSTNSPLLLPKVIFSSNPSNMFCCSLTLSPLPQATPHLQSIPLTALPFPLFSSCLTIPITNQPLWSTGSLDPPAIATPHPSILTWKCPRQPPTPSPSFPAT